MPQTGAAVAYDRVGASSTLLLKSYGPISAFIEAATNLPPATHTVGSPFLRCSNPFRGVVRRVRSFSSASVLTPVSRLSFRSRNTGQDGSPGTDLGQEHRSAKSSLIQHVETSLAPLTETLDLWNHPPSVKLYL